MDNVNCEKSAESDALAAVYDIWRLFGNFKPKGGSNGPLT